MENKRQVIELADIFGVCGDDFLKTHNLCPDQLKAYHAIQNCRTAALGGHTDQCDQCGHCRQSYNSCRNRHCPKCLNTKKLQWVDKLAANLPPVRHFHMVFTIPACLHKIFYINQSIAYSLLFKAAGKTLLQSASNPELLGVQAGAIAVLHTWGQTLVYHPHIHMIVPAGGLSDDQMEWISSSKKFFLPVKLLSKVFRGILYRAVEIAVSKNEMTLPDNIPDLENLKEQCYQKEWVVYCQKPFATPEAIIRYLGNYTHRVAISNHRIEAFDGSKVTFGYKDYKSGSMKKSMTLEANEFIRRFLQHVLPCGFYKIRYFGILALCNLRSNLETWFSLIDNKGYFSALDGLNTMEVWGIVSGKDPLLCPKCNKGKMVLCNINSQVRLATG